MPSASAVSVAERPTVMRRTRISCCTPGNDESVGEAGTKVEVHGVGLGFLWSKVWIARRVALPGRIVNCQIGTVLAYASTRGYAID
jgi:hypothetical protein